MQKPKRHFLLFPAALLMLLCLCGCTQAPDAARPVPDGSLAFSSAETEIADVTDPAPATSEMETILIGDLLDEAASARESRFASAAATEPAATTDAATTAAAKPTAHTTAAAGTAAPSRSGGNGGGPPTYDRGVPDVSYVLNNNTMKFHRPACSSVQQISPRNYAESNESRDALIAQGYTPCGACHP